MQVQQISKVCIIWDSHLKWIKRNLEKNLVKDLATLNVIAMQIPNNWIVL